MTALRGMTGLVTSGKSDQRFQFLKRSAGVDRFRGERRGIAQVIGTSGGYQRGGGVEQHYITAG